MRRPCACAIARQERGRGKPERDGRDAVADEESSRYAHGRSLLNELVFGGADEQARKARRLGC